MAKKDLHYKDLKGYVLSPGDIYWIKSSSGGEVLIANKADYLNDLLLEKLVKAGHKLKIENQIDMSLKHEFSGLMRAHANEVLFKEKLHWKKRIFDMLAKSNLNRFELGQLAWMAWSNIDRDTVKSFIDFDLDLFKRSLNIASSYVFCALMLGYYQDQFLISLFNSTIENSMSLQRGDVLGNVKEELEKIRMSETLSDEDKNYIKTAFPKSLSWFGERYDGSGLNAFHKMEMSDLEKVLIALERHYSFQEIDGESIFSEIKSGTFHCEERIFSLLRRSLRDSNETAEMSA